MSVYVGNLYKKQKPIRYRTTIILRLIVLVQNFFNNKGATMSGRVIAEKRVSYGIVKLVEHSGFMGMGYRYAILVNDSIKEQSNDLNFLKGNYENKYW